MAKSHPARPDFTLEYRLFGQSIAPRTQEKRYASDDELKRGLFNRLLDLLARVLFEKALHYLRTTWTHLWVTRQSFDKDQLEVCAETFRYIERELVYGVFT